MEVLYENKQVKSGCLAIYDSLIYYSLVLHNKTSEVLSMLIKIIKDGNPKGCATFGDWFETTFVLPSALIANWEDVIDNIKVQRLKRRASTSFNLLGDEFPLDTPLYVDESIETGYKPNQEGTEGATGQ